MPPGQGTLTTLRYAGRGRRDPPGAGGTGPATHKIALRGVAEVDDEVRHLVRLAYDQNP